MGLSEHNRRIAAERTGWPAGALEACERLDAEHPGWSVGWLAECSGVGWERPAGYQATRLDQYGWRDENGARLPLKVFATRPAELVSAITAVDERILEAKEREDRLWASIRNMRPATRNAW